MSVPSWRRCVDVLQRPLASGALIDAALDDAAGLLRQDEACPSNLLAGLRSSLGNILKMESDTLIIEKACDVKRRLQGSTRLAGKTGAERALPHVLAASSLLGGGGETVENDAEDEDEIRNLWSSFSQPGKLPLHAPQV